MSRTRMRCSPGKQGCGKRFTLRKAPEEYKRVVRCPHCLSAHVNNVEGTRRAEQLRRVTCSCSAAKYPHEQGTVKGCLA